ncbi:MAG: pyridoxamine 5'-phosphate oxidase family protein [Defluviimonas sp.]|nr:pyridoxamine 5'-phosphate oxidase family protein [Paracoccaceae bacterium]MCC0062595.1 pyridoxamine 5'-phosphate oxidase family protein [Defluviimonas sp.]
MSVPAYARMRNAKRRVEDRAIGYAILDQGLFAHVGFVSDGRPMVIPMAYARDGDRLYIHGASKTRVVARTADAPICLTVTLIDGLVAARSSFNHSVNYRSVVVHGQARKVAPGAEFDRALWCITDHLLPGRNEELRAIRPREAKATGVLAIEIEALTVKVRCGQPVDEPEDRLDALWGGVLPVATALGRGVPDGITATGVAEPDSFAAARRKFSA